MADPCYCFEAQGPTDELLMKSQYVSDFFIAFAYFSIPLELIYFVSKSAFFPYRWVLMMFGAFIVLCGATHLINLWTLSLHTRTVELVMTFAKVATAAVSCLTALMLVHIIPDLLSVKTREALLKNKAEWLDIEKCIILKQEETGRHVRMLTHEIRSTLNRHTILRTTLNELGRTLGLDECVLWVPSRHDMTMHVTHTLSNRISLGSTLPGPAKGWCEWIDRTGPLNFGRPQHKPPPPWLRPHLRHLTNRLSYLLPSASAASTLLS